MGILSRRQGPAPAVSAVAESHIFARQDKRLLSANGLALSAMPRIPGPIPLSQIRSANILTEPDIQTVRSGLAGRTQASLAQYSRNVKARELQSAELRVELARARMKPQLDAALEALRSKLDTDVLNIQMDTAVKRQKYQFQLAVLQAQSQAQGRLWTAGSVKASPVDKRLKEQREKLQALDNEADGLIAELQQQYTKSCDAARAAWQEKMDTLEKNEKKAALQRAQEQIQNRTVQAQRAAKDFIAGLSRRRRPRPSNRIQESAWMGGSGAQAATQTANAQLRRSAVSIHKQILADAQTAVHLAEAVHPLGPERWSEQLVRGQ